MPPVKNTGKGPAPNTVITFTESAGKGGTDVLASTSAKVGDLPAGGDLPFQLAVGADCLEAEQHEIRRTVRR